MELLNAICLACPIFESCRPNHLYCQQTPEFRKLRLAVLQEEAEKEEARLAVHRRYYHRNAEKINERCKQWQKENRDRAYAAQQRWRKKNRDYINEWQRNRRKILRHSSLNPAAG